MHFMAYSLFALPLMDSKARKLMILVNRLFGGGMEFGQQFVPLRQMSFGDFVANTLGVFWGVFLATKLRTYTKVSN